MLLGSTKWFTHRLVTRKIRNATQLVGVYEFCFYKSGRREIIMYIFCIAAEQGFFNWSLWMSFRDISNILKLFPKWWCGCTGSIDTPLHLSMKRVMNFYPVLKCEPNRLGTKTLFQSQMTRAFVVLEGNVHGSVVWLQSSAFYILTTPSIFWLLEFWSKRASSALAVTFVMNSEPINLFFD